MGSISKMGFSEKAQLEGGFHESSADHNNKKWVIAGIALRAPLKPILTLPVQNKQPQEGAAEAEAEAEAGAEAEEGDECSTTTPTSLESRIPAMLTCPGAPRKRKPSTKFSYSRGVVRREFFITPPDLETVFIRHVEKAI